MNISLREYGILTTKTVESSLGVCTIDIADFEWIELTNAKLSEDQTPFIKPVFKFGERCLRVTNYVGVIETPSGTRIEILPKVFDNQDTVAQCRKRLEKMILLAYDIKNKDFSDASLQTFEQPLLECLIARFLAQTNRLIKQGLRSDYVRIENESHFIRGQLQLNKQLRKGPGNTTFNISYDEYLLDSPENRLIKLCLEKVLEWSETTENKRLCSELIWHMEQITASKQIDLDLSKWQNTRLMASYKPIKPWCELILNTLSPMAFSGESKGLSLLFPMERLFESYVAKSLKINKPFLLLSQIRRATLCTHQTVENTKAKQWFKLQPDLAIFNKRDCIAVLDCKWKLLDQTAANSKTKYRISQSDFYQMYAYGHKYLSKQTEKHLILIYPFSSKLKHPLPVFDFDDGIKLWVVPFDIDNQCLLGIEDIKELKYYFE